MQKIKYVIKKVISNDPFEILLASQSTVSDYSQAIHTYHSLTPQRKIQVMANLSKQLIKEHSNRYTLSLLVLFDYLAATAPETLGKFPSNILEHYQKKSRTKARSKSQKVGLAQSNFIQFYVQYLRVKVWEAKELSSFSSLQESTIYCQNALRAMKIVLKYDFVIDYVFQHSELKQNIEIAVENILRRVSEDLSLCIRYVDKWNHLIMEESSEQFRINEIYEQLIFVSKNIERFKALKRKIAAEIKFPKYQLNKDLNKTIQMAMLVREEEKKTYFYEKRTKESERGLIQTEGSEQRAEEEAMEITESQIFVNMKL